MSISSIFERLRQRRAPRPATMERTRDFTPREWADLPIHHPRRPEDA